MTAYRSVPVDMERDQGPDIYRMLLDKKVDVVTFTSASTVRNFVQLYGAEPVADLLRSVRIASIGPVTAEAAQQCGIQTSDHAVRLHDARPRAGDCGVLREEIANSSGSGPRPRMPGCSRLKAWGRSAGPARDVGPASPAPPGPRPSR